MNSNSDSERQTEFGIIIQMGNNCLGPKFRMIGDVLNDMSKASFKDCGVKCMDGCALWSIV